MQPTPFQVTMQQMMRWRLCLKRTMDLVISQLYARVYYMLFVAHLISFIAVHRMEHICNWQRI